MDCNTNRIEVSAPCGFEPNYNHMEGPVNFYTQPNYTLTPNLYSQGERQWSSNSDNHSSNAFCVVSDSTNQAKWSVHQPFYNAIPVPARQPHVLEDQNNLLNTPVHHQVPIQVKANPVYNPHTAVITHTAEYKEMIGNQDPNHQQLNRNRNASTHKVESETSIATNNLTNVYSQDQFSEDTESQDSIAEASNKRNTRGRMRIYKRGGTQETVERTNKTELIQMKLKGNHAVIEGHGPSGDSEPPAKVQKMSQPNEISQKNFESYQISSNVHTLQPKHIISWYLDYLIGENEEITEMSKSFTIPMNIFACDDFYYMDSLQKNISFPTPKFLQWMKINFPSINVNAIECFKKGSQKIQFDQREYWKNKPSDDIIKEVFYHFQQQRIYATD